VGTFKHDRRPVVDCSVEPSRTVQSEKDACDINRILERFRKTGQISHVASRMPVFGDVSEIGDFREAVERVERTRDWFVHLPAKVREKFANDPVALMDAISDPARHDELKALGLGPAVDVNAGKPVEVPPA